MVAEKYQNQEMRNSISVTNVQLLYLTIVFADKNPKRKILAVYLYF